MKKADNAEEGLSRNIAKSANVKKNIDLKTDFPLSEKDEVKNAEEKLRKKNR